MKCNELEMVQNLLKEQVNFWKMVTQYVGGDSFPTIDCGYDTSLTFWGRVNYKKTQV